MCLSPEFFLQRYTFMCIQRVPYSQMFLSHSTCSAGVGLGEPSKYGEPPLATANDIHDHPQAEQLGVKVETTLTFMQDLP